MAQFFPHARRQMAKRQISEREVETVLADYESSYPSKTPGRHCYVKTIGNRRIQVVVEVADGSVVTVFDQLQQT